MVSISTLYHVCYVFFRQFFAHLVCDSAQVACRDEASALSVKESENVVDVFGGISLDEPGSEEVDELLEGNVACSLCVEVQDELVDRLVAGVRAEGRQCTA